MDLIATNAIILQDADGENGRPFKARFLQAGLVKYGFGVCLLKKETIDKFVNTFVECPVIIEHKDNITEDDKQGIVNKIWFSPEDGWYWCGGVIKSDEAVKLIEDGYSVSCQYTITEYSNNLEKKLHNGNEYDKEILNGVFEHLAIVKNPRYEGAFIAVNAYIAKNAIARNGDIKTQTAQNSIDINKMVDFITNYKTGGTMDEETKNVFSQLIGALKAHNKAEEEDKKEDKKAENEDTDKRKLIDEVAGIMKSAGADDELIRTAIAKMEKLAYDKSEAGTVDNEEEENKEDKKEDEDKKDKEAENKCKNEDDEAAYEELKEKVEKEVKNKKAKNSLEALKSVFYVGDVKTKKVYMSQREGIELGKKLY